MEYAAVTLHTHIATTAGARSPGVRRRALLFALAAWLLCPAWPAAAAAAAWRPPIVFVHGDGDSAALWMTTLWRFESNGWPANRLFAADLPYPHMRDADDRPQPGRSSSAEHMEFLAAEVERVRRLTGAKQVVLMGNSRGGYAIRSYIMDGGGATRVSHVILGATPDHGRYAASSSLGSLQERTRESNGRGPMLQHLNIPQGPNGDEVAPGIRWMTIRSDNNDWAAQPVWLYGPLKGQPTGVSYDSPALRGAENIVIPGIDHCEASYGPQAFGYAYRFITGAAPATLEPIAQARVRLSGKVFGLGVANDPATGQFENNLPLGGAQVEVFRVDAASGARVGRALLSRTIGADGVWGPLAIDSRSALEFVIRAPGYASTHVYHAPFPRSSRIVHLQARVLTGVAPEVTAVVIMNRPRGFLAVPRDTMSFDGHSPPPGIPTGVARVHRSVLELTDSGRARPIVAEFNGERVTGRTWAAHENHLVVLELHQ